MIQSTQDHLPIKDIREDLVFLKDGGVSEVIVTSAVNFGLLFENEQQSIINSFAQLLNSLSFQIQIIIVSRRLDVSSYLKILDIAISSQGNELLKKMTVSYRKFVESLIRDNEVLDKQFYIALNVSHLEIGIMNKNFDDQLKKVQTILGPRQDHLLRQLDRIGLKGRILKTDELIKLFYDLYNTTYIENSVETQVGTKTAELVKKPEVQQPLPTPKVSQPISVAPQPKVQTPTPQPIPQETRVYPPTPQVPIIPQASPVNNMPFVVEELRDDAHST